MGQTAFLLWCSLATTATTAVILFKSKTYNLGKGYSTKKSENTGIAKKGGVLTLPRFFCGFDSLKFLGCQEEVGLKVFGGLTLRWLKVTFDL